jgi:non-specific serine/threonine protein kinase
VPGPPPPPALAHPLRIGADGRFELRPAEYRLLVDGQPAALGGRALDLLLALAARPGELLTKARLLDLVWPGLVVEENNLRVQINTLRRVLGEGAIATVPGRGYRFTAALQALDAAGQPALLPPAASPGAAATLAPAGLPAGGQPGLFGRGEDLAALEAGLQAGGGCTTLVGMPGVGKSSLARLALARWAGPSAWVDLAPLGQGAQIPGAIARALGAQLDDGDPLPPLLRLLDGQPLLLVLDNAEHLAEACAGWAQAFAAAPALRLLLTSQLPLGLATERLQRLEPLAVTDGPGLLERPDGALALMLARIRQADSRYPLGPAQLPLLLALCRQLDGLPLALEMAAARVPLMGLQAVHDALAERFALLARGRRDALARHRTLHDALDWSYQLLSPAEQRLFRALGVFAGSFSLDLAVGLSTEEHVGRWDVVDGLAALAERSLVTVSGDEPPRYRLLETLRAFALARLGEPAAAAEWASLRRRHAVAVLALFTGPQGDANSLSEAEARAEMDNAREAFAWAREHDLATAAQLGARLTRIVGFTVWRQEVTDWMLSLQPLMAGPAGHALAPLLQADWWSMLAYLLNVRRSAAARPAAECAVGLWRQLGNPLRLHGALCHWVRAITDAGPELARACAELEQVGGSLGLPAEEVRMHGALAEAARLRGDVPARLKHREQELRLSRSLGWTDMAQATESNVCVALLDLGRHAEAASRAQALVNRLAADGGERNGNLPWALNVLIEALTGQGRLDEAQALLPRSLAAGRQFGTTVAWQGVLGLLLAQGRHPAAARLAGHLQQRWDTGGASHDPDERRRLLQCLAVARAHLGPDEAEARVAEGRRLSDDAATALAVDFTPARSSSGESPTPPPPRRP